MNYNFHCEECGSSNIMAPRIEPLFTYFHCLKCGHTTKINKPHEFSQEPTKYTYLAIYSILIGSNTGLSNGKLETDKPIEDMTLNDIRALEKDYIDMVGNVDMAALIDWKRINNG